MDKRTNALSPQLDLDLMPVPGTLTRVGWEPPKRLSKDQWAACGSLFVKCEAAVQWWLGDWWCAAENRKWGDGEEAAEKIGVDYGMIRNYASVARAYHLSQRCDKLTFAHHSFAMSVTPHRERMRWLARAQENGWTANELKRQIAFVTAADRTKQTELDAKALGKFVVLYADPPWQYEHPPIGGTNRSIEKEYPTMTIEQICALPVSDVAHENSILFLWGTNPKLYECMKVFDAWQFQYRTNAAWVKDKIGMGYHFRERHELLLVAKRGELAPPIPENRPDSIIEAPRLEHSAKPPIFYDLLDRMYPDIRKIELFARTPMPRPLWTVWGNQAGMKQNE